MIRVTVAYTNEPDKKFDWDYFVGPHRTLIHRELDSRGMVRFEQDKGVSGSDPNAPAPFVAMAHLTFNTADEVHEAFRAAGRAVMGDIPNYTDIPPTVQISEIAP